MPDDGAAAPELLMYFHCRDSSRQSGVRARRRVNFRAETWANSVSVSGSSPRRRSSTGGKFPDKGRFRGCYQHCYINKHDSPSRHRGLSVFILLRIPFPSPDRQPPPCSPALRKQAAASLVPASTVPVNRRIKSTDGTKYRRFAIC